MEMEQVTKIKNNLHLIGSKVYSYNTHVATIEDGKLITNGKYSSTTTRHISVIANMYGLDIVWNNERKSFRSLPYGVNVKFK